MAYQGYMYQAQLKCADWKDTSGEEEVILMFGLSGLSIHRTDIVSSIEEGSNAEEMGVKPGWEISVEDDLIICKPLYTESFFNLMHDIEKEASESNKYKNLEGIMVTVDNWIVQFIEGEPSDVENLIKSIQDDERIVKGTFQCLANFTTSSRLCPESMKFQKREKMKILIEKILYRWKINATKTDRSDDAHLGMGFDKMTVMSSKIVTTRIFDQDEYSKLKTELLHLDNHM